ncbi:hypothetical protein PSOS111911_07265 [Pseudoalteromonas ostreae]
MKILICITLIFATFTVAAGETSSSKITLCEWKLGYG